MKTKSIISKISWTWVACGGVLGYFVIYPTVMIIAYLMFHSRLEDASFLDVIRSELMRLFSADMLPWSITFTLISATAAGFFGRIRQINAALRKTRKGTRN